MQKRKIHKKIKTGVLSEMLIADNPYNSTSLTQSALDINKIDNHANIDRVKDFNRINVESFNFGHSMNKKNQGIFPEHGAITMPEDKLNQGMFTEHISLPTTEDKLNKEDIQELIKEAIQSENKLGEKDVESLVNKKMQSVIKQAQEASNIGLKIIYNKLNSGGQEKWFCCKCRAPIEEFKGLSGFNLIKKYLEKFFLGKLKSCPKSSKHLNWFEIKDDGMVWAIKTLYDCEFRIKSTRHGFYFCYPNN